MRFFVVFTVCLWAASATRLHPNDHVNVYDDAAGAFVEEDAQTPTPTVPADVPPVCANAHPSKGAAETDVYDYVVVGSGAGGGTLAARLAEAGHTVAVVEAGGDPMISSPDKYSIPAWHTLSTEDDDMSFKFMVNHYSDSKRASQDSKYVSHADPQKQGVFYPRAGTLGGCTAHNAMIMVYGFDSDWDHLAHLVEDPTFNGANMRKYFQKFESCHFHPIKKFFSAIFDSKSHGYSGWMPSTLVDPTLLLPDFSSLANIAVSPGFHYGFPFDVARHIVTDINDRKVSAGEKSGIALIPCSITPEGHRYGVRDRLKAVETQVGHDKLKLLTGKLATKILFKDTTAVGVEYIDQTHSYKASPKFASPAQATRKKVYARHEVIIAGGTFNTPQLLMLSGLGPTAELTKHNIPVLVDLPVLGTNMQDRYEVGVVSKLKKSLNLLEKCRFQKDDDCYKEWQKGKGAYTTNGGIVGVLNKATNGPQHIFTFGVPSEFRGYSPGYSETVTKSKDTFTWAVLVAHTQNNAGTVKLRSDKPEDTPIIDFNYFSDESHSDLDAVVEGVKMVREFSAKSPLAIDHEVWPGAAVKDDALKEWIKKEAWGHHACCTAKMGKDKATGVVDKYFRVFGTERLRVVDASVFPKIPGVFIVTPVYQIAEKAADLILAARARCAGGATAATGGAAATTAATARAATPSGALGPR